MDSTEQTNNSRFSEMTYYISLISNVLAIQSFSFKKKNLERQSDNIYKIAVFMSVLVRFIDLQQAKSYYDDLLKQKNVNSKKICIAKDLLTSSLFSTIGSLYLLKATLRT